MLKRISEEIEYSKELKFNSSYSKTNTNFSVDMFNLEEIISDQEFEIKLLKSELLKERTESLIKQQALEELSDSYKTLYSKNRNFLIESFNQIIRAKTEYPQHKLPPTTFEDKSLSPIHLPLQDSCTSPISFQVHSASTQLSNRISITQSLETLHSISIAPKPHPNALFTIGKLPNPPVSQRTRKKFKLVRE